MHTSETFFSRARIYSDSYFFEEFLLLESELEMLKADTLENSEESWLQAIDGFNRALKIMALFADSQDPSNAAYADRNARFACERMRHIFSHAKDFEGRGIHSMCDRF